jgi:ABC-2 type transport system permease protein
MIRTLDIVRIFALKDLRIALTYRLSFVMGILSTFFTMITFFFVTRVVGHSASVGTPADYFRFLVIGVTTSNILRAAVVAASTKARGDQVQGTLEILATQPISPLALALGWSALPVMEAIVEWAILLALAVPLGFTGFSPDWISVLFVLLISTTAFLAIGFIGAAVVLAIQQGTGMIAITVGLMGLVGGAVFPTSVLPNSMHILTLLSPLTYTLRSMRGAMLHGEGLTELLGGDLGIVLIYAAISMAIALVALHGSFRFARSRAALSRF